MNSISHKPQGANAAEIASKRKLNKRRLAFKQSSSRRKVYLVSIIDYCNSYVLLLAFLLVDSYENSIYLYFLLASYSTLLYSIYQIPSTYVQITMASLH